MTLQDAKFNLAAAADALVNGGIIVPEFQKEIADLVRRAGALQNRIQYVPATGSPSRFFEQTAIADGQFTQTGSGAAGGGTITPTSTSPTRVEKSVVIKAVTNRIDYSLFDLETIAQQNIWAQLKAKDLKDMINGILRLHGKGLWAGTDLVSGSQVGGGGTGAQLQQYVGILNQVTKTTTIASGASIIDGIRTQVAQLMADPNYSNNPSAVYMNPLALDFLEQEAKNSSTVMRYLQTNVENVVAGVHVTTIMTAAGPLPLIPEPFLPMDATIPGITAATGGQHNYPFAILNEDLVEYHYVGSKEPRVFQLGTLANLQESYVGIMFGAPVVKGPGYAHVVGVIQR
jgi:uncharacterized protein (DUF433 family)